MPYIVPWDRLRFWALPWENPMGKCEKYPFFAHFGHFPIILKQNLIFQTILLVIMALWSRSKTFREDLIFIKTYIRTCTYRIFSLRMYLTWPVGREGMKYLTPREGINFFPARRRRKGKKFFTFPRGEVFYTFPPNWSGKAFLHSSHTCNFTPNSYLTYGWSIP